MFWLVQVVVYSHAVAALERATCVAVPVAVATEVVFWFITNLRPDVPSAGATKSPDVIPVTSASLRLSTSAIVEAGPLSTVKRVQVVLMWLSAASRTASATVLGIRSSYGTITLV